MERSLAILFMAELTKLDEIYKSLHQLTEQMPDNEGKRVRQIIGNFVADMYTDIEMEIIRSYPDLNREGRS